MYKNILVYLRKIILRFEKYLKKLEQAIYCKYHIVGGKRFLKNNKIKIRNYDMVYVNKIKEYLNKHFKGYDNPMWHLYYYSMNRIQRIEYIPPDLWFGRIVSRVNPEHERLAYGDKNKYDLFLKDIKRPMTLARIYSGKIFDMNYNMIDSDQFKDIVLRNGDNKYIVIKKSINSGGGKDIIVNTAEYFLKNLFIIKDRIESKKEYIVQAYVNQSKVMSELNSSSLNTIKILTTRVNGDIKIVSPIMRIGGMNSIVDNISHGGIAVGINDEGYLNKYGVTNKGGISYKHPDHGYKFENILIPGFSKAKRVAESIHRKLKDITMVGFDMAIEESGEPVLIEMNFRYIGIHNHQICNGPLFKDNTYEVLQYFKEINIID